jgi:hypothetical protein
MRKIWIVPMAVLFGSAAAFAQEPSLQESQKQSYPAQQQEPAKHNNPAGTTPPPPLTQPKAPIADQAAPAAVGPAQADTASASGGPTVLGATAQTMPSTISQANAELDKKPITALQFPLTDKQRQLIADSLTKAPKTKTDANYTNVHVATFLPINAPMQAFPDELTKQFPDAGRYKYVKLDDRLLIVDPTILSVVGEIKL